MRPGSIYKPVGGEVTSLMGYRVHPVTGRKTFHNGVDFDAEAFDSVYNVLDGIVIWAGPRGGYGNTVEIFHPTAKRTTLVAHLSAYTVQAGNFVERGRVIGYAGSSGLSTGVHVHYTVKSSATGELIDPMVFLARVPEFQRESMKSRPALIAGAKKIYENFAKTSPAASRRILLAVGHSEGNRVRSHKRNRSRHTQVAHAQRRNRSRSAMVQAQRRNRSRNIALTGRKNIVALADRTRASGS